jgi:dephospho-CoA kinase
VVVVTAPRALQISRVKARRGMSDSEIEAMIRLQMPDAAKLSKADTIVRTGLSRYYAVRQIRRFLAAFGSRK